jgi:UDP-glucose-4-epimerase GalE
LLNSFNGKKIGKMGSDNNNVLVVGGAGYIGSHTCKALKQRGFRPVVLDNLSTGHRWAVKWGPLVVGDLINSHDIFKVLDEYKPIAVMHFAACAYVGESVQHPDKYYRNNVVTALNLIDAVVERDIASFVFSSSCATYGIPKKMPITEQTPQNPVNPYGRTKLFVEQILSDYDHAYGLKSACLRYFNAAGADLDGELGECHDPEPHLIPRVLSAAAGSLSHVEIYGDDYNTPDGTCIRDFVHVWDLARAHCLALDYLLNNNRSLQVNLGGEKGYSVHEVIALAERISGKRISARVMARRKGDPPLLVASAKRAHHLLGWHKKNTSLDCCIETAWKWDRENSCKHSIAHTGT